jgi:hypothetical protein
MSQHIVFRFDKRPAMLSNRKVQHVNSDLAIHVERNVTLMLSGLVERSRMVQKSGDLQQHSTPHTSDT